MLGKVMWEALSFRFGAFRRCFEEGRGLQNTDLQQVTLRHRRTKTDIRGLQELCQQEQEGTAHNAQVWSEACEAAAALCASCLQHREECRYTMQDCVRALGEVQRVCGLEAHDRMRESEDIALLKKCDGNDSASLTMGAGETCPEEALQRY